MGKEGEEGFGSKDTSPQDIKLWGELLAASGGRRETGQGRRGKRKTNIGSHLANAIHEEGVAPGTVIPRGGQVQSDSRDP